MAVYDDQEERTSTHTPSDEELRNLTGINEEQESAHEREATSGAARDILAREHAAATGVKDTRPDLRSQAGLIGSGAADLAAQERAAQKQAKQGKKIPNTDLRGSEFGFKNEKLKGLSGLKEKAKKYGKKKWLIGGAIGGGGVLLVVLLMLMFLIGAQLIPNFAQNMIAYSFARVARESMDSDTKVITEKIATDSATDSAYNQAENEFSKETDPVTNENMWDKVQKFNMRKTIDNMQADKRIYVEYGPDQSLNPIKKLSGRQTVHKIYVNGNEIDIPQNSMSTFDKMLHPIDYAQGLWESNKAILTSVYDSIDTTFFGSNWLRALSGFWKVKALENLSLYRWSKKQLQQEDAATPEEADVLNAQQNEATTTNDGAAIREAEDGLTPGSQEQQAADAAAQAEQACVQDATCVKGVINDGGGMPSTVIAILNKFFASSFLKTFIKVIGPTYAIAAPLCMMYEASIFNSGGVINANSGELQRTSYEVLSAADQQKYGNVNGNAVGAQARQMGTNSEIATSNVMKRASGIPVDTSQSGVNPQSSAGGTYTYDVFDFLGPSADGIIQPIINPMCKVFDNPWTGVAIGSLFILLPPVRAGIEAVGEAAGQGIARIVADVASEMATTLGSTLREMVTKKELAKMLAIGGATIAGSFYAKYITLQHMGALNNGMTRNQSYDNQAEAGSILNAQSIDRQQNMAAPMDASGTAQAKTLDAAYITQQEQSKSVFQRYFAISNAQSLVSRLGVMAWAHMNLDTIPSLLLTAGRIFNPITMFSSVFSFMQNKSLAAASTTTDTTDYNIVQTGWTPIEEWHYKHDGNYSMFYNQQQLDKSGQEQTISQTYMKCFTSKMGTLLSQGDLQRTATPDVIDSTNAGICAPDNLGPSNQDDPIVTDKLVFANPTAALVFRWRVAIRDQNNLNDLSSAANPSANDNTAAAPTTTGGCGSGKYGALVGSGASFAGVDQGIDFVPSGSGAYNICAPASGTITLADQTGHHYLRTSGTALVIEKLDQAPNAPSSSQYIYFAELINVKVSPNTHVNKGDVIGTNNQSPGIEVGWGLSPTNGFMCAIAYPSPCGTSFNSWVQAQ